MEKHQHDILRKVMEYFGEKASVNENLDINEVFSSSNS